MEIQNTKRTNKNFKFKAPLDARTSSLAGCVGGGRWQRALERQQIKYITSNKQSMKRMRQSVKAKAET